MRDTALIRAVMAGNIERVRLLITPETINLKGGLGKTALHNAVLRDYRPEAILDALLANGANVNVLDDDGLTPSADAGKNARTIDDIFARRACKLIERGALWPDTPMANFMWQKLPSVVQQFFTEKLQAYQQQQEQIQAEEKTKAFGVLSGYARNMQANSNSSRASSTGLHHRNAVTELKVFNN
ncbi:MAG: ankyrin repeat domain-containing protein [Legionellales bacterium]|jgi:hypothetical protein